MKKLLCFLFYNVSVWLSLSCQDLGEMFDVLMGKNTNPYYSSYKNPTETTWCDSYPAYCLSRLLFEKSSIESGLKYQVLKIPKIIHQIWLGGLVPKKYAKWMSTWSEHHPDWTYILWTDDDIQYLRLFNRDLFNKAKNYGEKSDILRVELINLFGGLYIDTDYECLKPLDQFHHCNSFYVSAIPYGGVGFATNNALIAAPPRHPLLKKLVETMKKSAKFPDLSNRTGPIYFTRTIFENFDLIPKDATIYPPCYFTPDPYAARTDENSYAIHRFDASWVKSQSGEEKIFKDTRVEKILTLLYLRTNRAKKRYPLRSKLYYDVWTNLFAKLQKRVIVEVGACQFIIDKTMDLNDLHYFGISPVKFLVIDNRLHCNAHENRTYLWKDWLTEELPKCGLLIIGGVIEYLPCKDCLTLLQKIGDCDPEFFIIAHNKDEINIETELGKQRSLNMCQVPFNLPEPERIITVQKKTYGVWKYNDL